MISSTLQTPTAHSPYAAKSYGGAPTSAAVVREGARPGSAAKGAVVKISQEAIARTQAARGRGSVSFDDTGNLTRSEPSPASASPIGLDPGPIGLDPGPIGFDPDSDRA